MVLKFKDPRMLIRMIACVGVWILINIVLLVIETA